MKSHRGAANRLTISAVAHPWSPCAMLMATTLLAGSSLAAAKPVERLDAKGLTAMACGSENRGSERAWNQQVFDAQIEGRRVEGLGGRAPTLDQMRRSARALARVKRYHGFAAGLCPDQSGWAVAFPAGAPLKREDDSLILPLPALEASCQSWRVDFAPTAEARPRELHANGRGRIDTAKLGDGTIGVTCQPKLPRWQGPVLWYLAPVGKGPAAEPPALEMLSEASKADTAEKRRQLLASWLNRVRVRAGEKPVVVAADLNTEASVLAIDPSLVHNRQLLKRAADAMDGRRSKLLGENRVKGDDLREVAWLLWSSPRHRDLILSPSATSLGLAESQARGERLTVMIFAAEEPLVTVKGPGPGKPGKAVLR